MKSRFLYLILIAIFTVAISCKRKCEEPPTYSLCPEQTQWFRPSQEKWLFIKDGTDTITATLSALERFHGEMKGGWWVTSSNCPRPKYEKGNQTAKFSTLPNLTFTISAHAEEKCLPINYGDSFEKSESIKIMTVKGKTYSDVIKEYKRKTSYGLDTIYYNQEFGLIKLIDIKEIFVGKEEKLQLERIFF